MKRLIVLLFFACLLPAGPAAAQAVTPADRTTVIEAVIRHLESNYVDPAVGHKAAEALKADLKAGTFGQLSDGEAFADALSRRMQALTGDGHLNVQYSKAVVPVEDKGDDSFAAGEMERWYGAHLNFGVEKVERLKGNIGLLDLRVFAPIDMGGDTVAAAMTILAHTDALIIDLRNNGGGIGDMAVLVASYLFGTEPQPMSGLYDRPSDTLTQQYTQAYVPGARFGKDKPVYILISHKTFSAAEGLAYDLQALKRAVIVGEPSGGGAHPFDYVRISPHYVLWSVTGKSVNPITHGDWQGKGVQPDIRVPAADALDAALKAIRASGKLKTNN